MRYPLTRLVRSVEQELGGRGWQMKEPVGMGLGQWKEVIRRVMTI